ncbi:hypothetical protein Drorol1_Dr00021301, partial [Drosera rotundifolia]
MCLGGFKDSAIRVSSIVVFPACVVFGIGFSFGYLNGGPVKGMRVFGGKRKPCGSASYRFLNQDARSRSVDRGEEIRRLLDYAKTNAFKQSVRRRRIIDD